MNIATPVMGNSSALIPVAKAFNHRQMRSPSPAAYFLPSLI
jgi:hypothetical protein